MNNSPLTAQEKNLLIQVVGGPATARALISGSKVLKDRFPIFTEVVVGGVAYRPKGTTLNHLMDKGYIKDEVVPVVLTSPAYSISNKRIDLKLARVDPESLGLSDGGTYADIMAAAKKFDLGLCPEDTAAAIMLQLSVGWTSGIHVVATQPIVHHRKAHLFQVAERRLTVVPGDKDHHWGPFDNFLFRRY